jgi:cysteinyl-tRNA synthetase
MSDEVKKQIFNILDERYENILMLLKHREDYRKVGQYDKADKIRDILLEKHRIQLNDTPTGLEVLNVK